MPFTSLNTPFAHTIEVPVSAMAQPQGDLSGQLGNDLVAGFKKIPP